jgi:hypothetical protein
MKAIFVTSAICVISTVLALAALSATSVIPSSAPTHARFMVVVAGFFVSWLFLAVWTRTKLNASSSLPHWVPRTIAGVGGVYALAILVFAIG